MPYGIFRVIHGRVQGTPKGCHREKKEVTPGTPGGPRYPLEAELPRVEVGEVVLRLHRKRSSACSTAHLGHVVARARRAPECSRTSSNRGILGHAHGRRVRLADLLRGGDLALCFPGARDKAKITAAVTEQMPNVMAYLEKIAPAGGFIFGELSIADLAIAFPFSNLKWARVEPDVSRWPRACAWVERTLATTAPAKLTRIADKLVQTAPDRHRVALVDLGVQLTDATIAGDKPRSSIMLDRV